MCVYVYATWCVCYLVCAGLLQSVHHGLKLQRFDLHLSVQSVEQSLVLGVHVVVGLLQVQTQSCRTTYSTNTLITHCDISNVVLHTLAMGH